MNKDNNFLSITLPTIMITACLSISPLFAMETKEKKEEEVGKPDKHSAVAVIDNRLFSRKQKEILDLVIDNNKSISINISKFNSNKSSFNEYLSLGNVEYRVVDEHAKDWTNGSYVPALEKSITHYKSSCQYAQQAINSASYLIEEYTKKIESLKGGIGDSIGLSQSLIKNAEMAIEMQDDEIRSSRSQIVQSSVEKLANIEKIKELEKEKNSSLISLSRANTIVEVKSEDYKESKEKVENLEKKLEELRKENTSLINALGEAKGGVMSSSNSIQLNVLKASLERIEKEMFNRLVKNISKKLGYEGTTKIKSGQPSMEINIITDNILDTLSDLNEFIITTEFKKLS